MTHLSINPPGLQDPTPDAYSHVSLVKPNSQLIYLAGQIGVDKEGKPAPTLQAQADQVFRNIKACLAAANTTVRNLVSVTVYIVDYDAVTCPIWPAFKAFLTDEQGPIYPAATLVPVSQLAKPELKIEIQCVAATDGGTGLPAVPPTTGHPTSTMQDVDVVVVGAGLAGLQAATDVHRAGLSCIVLEAKDRVGGKTQSVPMATGKGVVDVGAAWINHKTQRRMYALFQTFGFEPLIQRMAGCELFGQNGQTSRVRYQDPLPISARDQQIYDHISSCMDADAQTIDIYDSTANSHIEDISLGQYLRNKGAVGPSFDLWTVWIRGLTGCEPDDISLVYWLDYVKSGQGLESLLTEEPNGAQYLRNRHGNQSISRALAAALAPGSVRLSSPVCSIIQTSKQGSLVSTTGGQIFRCKKVLVSVPTPLYRHIEFSPPLSVEKLEIAGATHLGPYSKCVVVYKEPWWRDADLNGSFLGWGGPVSFSRDVSSDEDGMFAIACFIVGDNARQWAKLSPSQRVRQVKDQLARMVGPDLEGKVRDTVQVIEKQWMPEQWSEGAPCPMVAPGGIWAKLGNELRRPAGNVHFIGTETAYEWKGYMEGAVASGERGAREVIEALRGAGGGTVAKL